MNTLIQGISLIFKTNARTTANHTFLSYVG